MKRYILIFFLLMSGLIFAQGGGPDLEIFPKQIKFSDGFDKIRNVTITNLSTGQIKIDSISFPDTMLNLRKNNFRELPVNLAPAQMISFDVILLDFAGLSDSSAVLKIFNSSKHPVIDVPVSIGFDMPRKMRGEISGTVADTLGPIAGADVYFFHHGIYLLDSAKTGPDGSFQKQLPRGEYFVAAVKDGYYMQYSDGKDSPLDADFVLVDKMKPASVNFILEKQTVSQFVITGRIKDENSDEEVKSVVVIRKGIHTPTKVSAQYADDFDKAYAVLTDNSGNYEAANIPAGEYYVQAFAGYYLPGYFNEANASEVFWQNADSVNVDGALHNCDIFLARDSSFGGGVAKGKMHWKDNRSERLDDALVYTISENNEVYSFSFSKLSGDFEVPNLPRGKFKLRAQKFGVPDAETQLFEITDNADTVQNLDITFTVTEVEENVIPVGIRLYQNYPNPFNPSTTIGYSIPETGFVSIKIYDILGNEIKTLVNNSQPGGTHSIRWNGNSSSNRQVASGTYFYKLSYKNSTIIKKMLYLR